MADSSSTSSFSLPIRLALFALLIAILDFAIGTGLSQLYRRSKEGDFGGRINLALEQRHDVVIFGSSRALHHYIPDILDERMEMSSFNAGMDAQTLLYHYGLQQMILDRYQPKLLILDLNTEDIRNDPEKKAYEKLSRLLPFHQHPEVHQLIVKRSRYERFKLWSKTYPYNSQVLSIIRYTLKPDAEGSKTRRGYIPLHGSHMSSLLAAQQQAECSSSPQLDREYVGYLHRFIQKARNRGIPVVVVSSPLWEMKQNSYEEKHKGLIDCYKQLLLALDVPLIEITQKNYPLFRDPSLFKDLTHLNHEGAKQFSAILGDRLATMPL